MYSGGLRPNLRREFLGNSLAVLLHQTVKTVRQIVFARFYHNRKKGKIFQGLCVVLNRFQYLSIGGFFLIQIKQNQLRLFLYLDSDSLSPHGYYFL